MNILKLAHRPPPPRKKEHCIRLPYLGRPSEQMARYLKQFGYRAGFHPILSIKSLSTLKDPIPMHKKPDIHRVNCPNVPPFTLGKRVAVWENV